MPHELPQSARYLPFLSGNYDVRPGLRRFGHDFGNGAADSLIFQIDCQFNTFRAAKLAARREHFARHVLFERYPNPTATAVTQFIVDRLVREHPRWFDLRSDAGGHQLDCALTAETLGFDRQWQFDAGATRSGVAPAYTCAWDALACQCQEDLAVTCTEGSENWVAALHVCLPSHWRPEEKVGRDFVEIHGPVPGMEPAKWKVDKFVDRMVGATDGRVRFAWGLQWNDRLNRHPDLDEPASVVERFDPANPRAFVRVERQTLWGLPEVGASLFTIRPYLLDACDLRRDPRHAAALAAAIESMSPASLCYKGLARSHRDFVEWLGRPETCRATAMKLGPDGAGG